MVEERELEQGLDQHGFDEGCRCDPCVWDAVVKYDGIIHRVAHFTKMRNPWVVRDKDDLYTHLVGEAYRILKGHRTGPIAPGVSSPGAHLKFCLSRRAWRYVKSRFAPSRIAEVKTTHSLNTDGSISDPRRDADEDSISMERVPVELDPGYEQVEAQVEAYALLAWINDNFVESATSIFDFRQRQQAARRFRQHLLDGETLAFLAEKDNVTRQAVQSSINRVHRFINENHPRFTNTQEES